MLKIMTFNLANYDDHADWPVRLQMFADIIEENQPDISSLQETRFNPDNSTTQLLYQNMAEQILYELNLRGLCISNAIVTQPVMFYSDRRFTFPAPSMPTPRFGDALCKWEGLSLLSNRSVIESGTRFISVPNDPESNPNLNNDPNKRSVTFIKVYTPSGQPLFVFNCHFSYNIDDFQSNVQEALHFMTPYLQYPCMLMGDMNQTEQDPHPDVAAKVTASFDLLRNAGLYDVWAKLHPDDPGYTDRSTPQRIDYIWANFDSVSSISLLGTTPNAQGIYPSDHYGLIAQIDL